MKSALKITLKPGEKIYVNGAVIRAERKTTFEFLNEVVMQLLSDMIPPTPINIQHRAAMLGRLLRLDIPTRLALLLLPSTGRFLKGSADAIFPAELG